jgi:glycolate oxidase iron-sulfur subunit
VTGIDRELISTCVHCGFCLPTCPTWDLWREEMDSPRGRIYLMEGLADGTLQLNRTVVEHFDRCLGCMACVSSCPSGVLYDRLIEQTRVTIEQEFRRPGRERALRSAVLTVVANPRRLRRALRLAPVGRRLPLPGFLRPLAELAPPWRSAAAPPELTEAVGERIARVGLLTGCVQRVLFGDVNTATARVLAAHGYEVAAPKAQGCCGALAVHAGRRKKGLELARKTIDAFEAAGVDVVASNAAGCGSNLKDYGRLLADDPVCAERAAAFSARVQDVSEILAAVEARVEPKPLELRIALQDSCHLVHAQGVRREQRALLGRVPGLDVTEVEDQALCCGSAGIYNLVQPEAASELGRRKAERVLAAQADAYAAANPGCLVQVTAALRRAGHPLPAFHPVELVDASLRGADPRELLSRARR